MGFPFDSHLLLVRRIAPPVRVSPRRLGAAPGLADRPDPGYIGLSMARRTTFLLVALLALLAAAPAAQASDSSAFKAWTSERNSLRTLETRLDKNLDTWANSKGTKSAPARETISKLRALIARRDKALRAEETSSSKGAKGKSNALASLRDYNAALLKLRAAVTGKFSQANARLKEYNALIKRMKTYENRALQYFEDAGVP